MTSSLKNSIHRRNHKERSQLAHRAKFGFLEKHKDYVKRARDYHSKQDRLTRLRQKAADKNKDEFYFSMTKEKTKGGVHIQDRGNVALPTDMIKLLKSQDENYIRTVRASGQKKIDKLKLQLATMVNLLDGSDVLNSDEMQVLQDAGLVPTSQKRKTKGRHIIFVEDEQQARSYTAPPTSSLSVPSSISRSSEPNATDLGWKEPPAVKSTGKRKAVNTDSHEDNDSSDDDEPIPPTAGNRRKLLRELGERLNRDKQLRYTEREFELQRLMMGKGSRKKLKGVERVDGKKDMENEDDEDALDSRKGKPLLSKQHAPKLYIPRVYKWHAERKR